MSRSVSAAVSASLRLAAVVCVLSAIASTLGCATTAVRTDRTDGIELEYLWTRKSEGQAAYYSVTRAGDFGSSGGYAAREREQNFKASLSDAEVARFVELLRATGYAARPDESGAGEPRSEITVRDASGRHRFTVEGQDADVDALRAFLAELSLRQFRNVIDAQPEAGPRRR